MARDGAIRFGYGVNGNAIIAAGAEGEVSGYSVVEPTVSAADTIDGEDKQGYIAWEYYLYGQGGSRSGQVRVSWEDNGQAPAYSHSATGDTRGDTHLVTVSVDTDGLGAINFNITNETAYQWNIIWHRVEQLRSYEYVWPNLDGPSLLLRIEGLEDAGKSWFGYTGNDELIGLMAEEYADQTTATTGQPFGPFKGEVWAGPNEAQMLSYSPSPQSGGELFIAGAVYPFTPGNPAGGYPTLNMVAFREFVWVTTGTTWETIQPWLYPPPSPMYSMTPIAPGYLLDGNILVGSVTLNGVTFSWQRHPGDLPGEWHNY